MSDEKLRELERRWKETGSVEDEAKYLLERVRVGDLEQEKLELAAYCGHEGARRGLGGGAPEPPAVLVKWIRGLPTAEACVAGAVGIVRKLLEAEQMGGGSDERARNALAAAKAWLLCPCADHALSAEEAARQADEGASAGSGAQASVAQAASWAAFCPTDPWAAAIEVTTAASWEMGADLLWAVLRRSVAAWALGELCQRDNPE